MKKDYLKLLFIAAVALLTVSCSKDNDNEVTVDRRVAVLLPDASIIDRWAIDKKNLENAMARYGLDATFYVAPETKEGAEMQVAQLRKVINDGAMERLNPLIESGELIVKSGKKEYDQVKANSWSVADGKSDMLNRLASYGQSERPDLILAAVDNQAQGAIEALAEKGITDMPIITGQDNATIARQNILDGKQTMTIDKSLEEMAFNTALIVNGLVHNVPVQTIDYVTIGSTKIPVMYSKLITMVKDSYPY